MYGGRNKVLRQRGEYDATAPQVLPPLILQASRYYISMTLVSTWWKGDALKPYYVSKTNYVISF